MLQFSHIKLLNEILRENGLVKHIGKRTTIGSVFPDSSLLDLFKQRGSFKFSNAHTDNRIVDYFSDNGEVHFAMGIRAHQITDDAIHGESLDGYAFQKAEQLIPHINRKYPFGWEMQRRFGHVLVEEALDERFVYSNGKPEEVGLLEDALKNCPDSLISKICKYYPTNQKEFSMVKERIKRLNFGFLADVESNRRVFAYSICRLLENEERKNKIPTNSLVGKAIKYMLNYCPDPFVWGIVHLPQKKTRPILYLFDKAKEVVADYQTFLREVKEKIREGIAPYIERIKTSEIE